MAGKKPAKTPVYGGFLSSFICLSALSPAARRYEFAPLSFFSTPGTEKLPIKGSPKGGGGVADEPVAVT